MSVHAMIAAAYVEGLPPTTRLILMAIADSSDEHTRRAAPGLPKLRAWSGRSKSQVLRVIAQLERDGFLAQDAAGKGRVGRRAEFTVFPHGIPRIPHPSEVAARYDDDSTGGDNPVEEGRTDATLDFGEGRISAPRGSHPRDPFGSSTSVSSASAPPRPGRRPVDTGFPGARQGDRPDPRTTKGFHDTPCPLHPEHIVPCGRCAHESATADPARVAAARALARAGARGQTLEETHGTP